VVVGLVSPRIAESHATRGYRSHITCLWRTRQQHAQLLQTAPDALNQTQEFVVILLRHNVALNWRSIRMQQRIGGAPLVDFARRIPQRK
jgi:hypothetical protein